ncbi:hypothetical protein [Nocardia salmonicida]|uniref:hypothetical protein n=1 Tax=Nocardia salmonicida TaxID=53431 RepID=UPI0033F39234
MRIFDDLNAAPNDHGICARTETAGKTHSEVVPFPLARDNFRTGNYQCCCGEEYLKLGGNVTARLELGDDVQS